MAEPWENDPVVEGDAPWARDPVVAPQQQRNVRPPVNQGEDIAASFGTGVERGVSGILQIPRAIVDASDALGRTSIDLLSRATGRQLTPQQRAEVIRRSQPFNPIETMLMPWMPALRHGPTTQELDQAVDALVPGERHVPQTTAGEYARTVGEFVPGMLFPGGAGRSAVTRLGSRAMTNVVAPALASEAAGQATEGTDLEPIARLGGAMLGGYGANAAHNIGTRGGLTPAERATRIITRRLGQADTSVDDLDMTARALRRQGGTTAETIAEVGGKPLQRAARAVANVDGEGQAIADAYLEARTGGVSRRLLGEVTRATSPRNRGGAISEPDFYEAREALRAARAQEGSRAYRTAHAQNVDQAVVQAELLPLMQRGPGAAISSAINQLESASLRAQSELALARRASDAAAIQRATDDLANIDEAMAQLRTVGNGQVPNRMNVRALDYYQRGLGQLADNAGYRSPEGAAMEQARQVFNRYLDEVAPAFGQARTNYGNSMRIEELMGEGRRVFNMPDGEIELLMRGPNGRGLTMDEFDGFMLGVMDALENKIRSGDTAFVTRFMRNQNWQRQLERAFTPPPEAARRALQRARQRSGSAAPITAADIAKQQERMARQSSQRLRNRIAREASMRRFDNAVRSPSQTTPMAEDIKALTQGESELGFLSEVIQGGGNLRAPALRVLARAWDRLYRPGIYNPEVNRELAQRLFQPATTGNVAQLRTEIAALRRRGMVIDAAVEQDLVRAAMLTRPSSQDDALPRRSVSIAPLEERAAQYSDEELEAIAAGAN